MNLVIISNSFRYETENLIRIFFPQEKINVTEERNEEENYIISALFENEKGAKIDISLCIFEKQMHETKDVYLSDKNEDETKDSFYERKIALLLYDMLCTVTNYKAPWGILTGVRPAKLMTNLINKLSKEKAESYFINELRVREDKTSLAVTVAEAESKIIANSSERSFSLYVSIPFCPTRCTYCSFVSHSNDSAKKLIPKYVELLCEEIKQTGEIVKKLNLKLESVYIGGGTPTALDAQNLKRVTDAISESFDFSSCREYTIESGRPDSITKEKLEVIYQSGAERISINPQTFNDSVLEVIGRKHTSKQTEDAMLLARECGFKNINMDLIAGLPTDTLESFENTLEKVLSFSPENITLHTLALKRSSTLVTEEKEKGSADLAGQMISYASKVLYENGYMPYYMYRQSRCLGNLENVGWAKKGYECEYNVYMMEECHSVLAVGAGAVTKLKNPYSSYLERIFNYKYPYEYINDFDEIINRKKKILDFYSAFDLN